MMVRLNSLVLWFTASLLYVKIVSSQLNNKNIYIQEQLCNGTFTYDTELHDTYNYTVDSGKTLTFPSCDLGIPNLNVYWFWSADICTDKTTDNKYFTYVSTNGTNSCKNTTYLHINGSYCLNQYRFNRSHVTIVNANQFSGGKYVCILATVAAAMHFKTTKIYNIDVVG